MSGLWHISAHLEHVGDMRRINYRVEKVSEYAYPTLGTVLFWCKTACEELLSDLEKKQADEKDLERIGKLDARKGSLRHLNCRASDEYGRKL
jgi:hypothetical protein